jgi:N-acetylglutamate synthase-like GNAT family acetyltransferase
VWKVGNEHVKDLLNLQEDKAYTLTLEEDFNEQFGFPRTEKEKESEKEKEKD